MEEQLFGLALGVEEPLFIERIEFDKEEGELHIHMNFRRGGRFCCSECGADGLPVHDTIEKTWRHLNFFQYKCYIHLRTPRTKCDKCGERLWIPPWGRSQSGFTLLFEALIMKLAQYMSVSAISDLVDEHDTRIWRIFRYWVEKAQQERDFSDVKKVGIDETSSKKGHDYITVFVDLESKNVLFATEGRKGTTVKEFVEELTRHNAENTQVVDVSIDMSPAFIRGVHDNLPKAQITFDKFHVVQALNKVMNEVWRAEVAQNPLLKKTRYVWLKNPENLTEKQQTQLKTVTKENTKTAKVYQMKLTFQDIYRNAKCRAVAEELINKWLNWAVRSRIEPVKKFAKMVKKHYEGIPAYFDSRLTSGVMEGINSRIQEVKRRAKGYRNARNFLDMIYLVCGNLELGCLA